MGGKWPWWGSGSRNSKSNVSKYFCKEVANEKYNSDDVMSVKQNADNVTWSFDDTALIDCRMPVPYQYSVLRQFDNDPDDDVVDPEHSLNMMVEDTSSDEEEIIDNANLSSTSSKTIGAIDTNPPDANAVICKKIYNFILHSSQPNCLKIT